MTHQLYCSLDFETTGLNTQKDDPIQVGLVIFDAQGVISASYSSLIQPSKSITELKEIVQFVTGFELSHLQYAPSAKEVFTQVAEYISNKNLILIGHNISFDLAILQRFLPHRKPFATIDTFDCARQLLHFQQSYALDALIHLDQQQGLNIFHIPVGKAHDALYDATASMQLFLRWYTEVKKLAGKYPLLSGLLTKNNICHTIFPVLSTFDFQLSTTFLPPLQSLSSAPIKVAQPMTDTGTSTSEDSNLKTLVQSIINQKSSNNNPLILAVNHPSKITILKTVLQQQAIVAHDSVHDLPSLNIENAKKLLQKSSFSRSEIGFLLKYFSQYNKGHTIIDCKSADDYKILHAITDLKSSVLETITLCTHQQIWSFRHKITPQHHIYFFDSDHWLNSYLQSMQQPIDLLHLSNLADQLTYRYELEEHPLGKVLEQITIQLSIFSARFHCLIGLYLTGTQATELECPALETDTRDGYARRLITEIDNYLTPYKEAIIQLQQGLLFINQREHMIEVLKNPYVVEKKTFNDSWYLLFHAPAYHVSYEDFLESLAKAEYHRIKSKEILDSSSLISSNSKGEIVLVDQNFQKLNTLLNHQKNLFILCQSKQFSKGLFDRTIKQKVDQHYSILAENITGGTGKALLFAKKSKKPILMIGSENYYYNAVGGGLIFEHIGLWYYKKELLQTLCADLSFYTL